MKDQEKYVFSVDKGPNTCFKIGVAGLNVAMFLLVCLVIAIVIWA